MTLEIVSCILTLLIRSFLFFRFFSNICLRLSQFLANIIKPSFFCFIVTFFTTLESTGNDVFNGVICFGHGFVGLLIFLCGIFTFDLYSDSLGIVRIFLAGLKGSWSWFVWVTSLMPRSGDSTCGINVLAVVVVLNLVVRRSVGLAILICGLLDGLDKTRMCL